MMVIVMPPSPLCLFVLMEQIFQVLHKGHFDNRSRNLFQRPKQRKISRGNFSKLLEAQGNASTQVPYGLSQYLIG